MFFLDKWQQLSYGYLTENKVKLMVGFVKLNHPLRLNGLSGCHPLQRKKGSDPFNLQNLQEVISLQFQDDEAVELTGTVNLFYLDK